MLCLPDWNLKYNWEIQQRDLEGYKRWAEKTPDRKRYVLIVLLDVKCITFKSLCTLVLASKSSIFFFLVQARPWGASSPPYGRHNWVTSFWLFYITSEFFCYSLWWFWGFWFSSSNPFSVLCSFTSGDLWINFSDSSSTERSAVDWCLLWPHN